MDVCFSDDDDDDEDEYRCREEEIGLVCLCGNEKVWPALGGFCHGGYQSRLGSLRLFRFLFFCSCLLDFMFQGILSYVVLEKYAKRGN